VLAVAGAANRRELLRPAFVLFGLALVSLSALAPSPAPLLAPAIAFFVAAGLAHRPLTAWRTLAAALVLVILFIPIRRYTMPGNLPFELEPYRVLVALIAGGWFVAMLVDPRVRLKSTGFEAPLLAYAAVALCSILANTSRIAALGVQTDVLKEMTFFASFLIVLYLIVSVVGSRAEIDTLVKLLVGGAAAVAVVALVESRTGYNPFNNLAGWIPILQLSELPEVPVRGARLRVYASAQHPIALGALFAATIPLAVYLLKRTGQRRWLVAGGVLTLAAMATVSRTAIAMLVVGFVVFLRLRPVATRRILPALIPICVAANLALPGTLGSLKEAFLPAGGVLAEQSAMPGYRGAGRIADLGPAAEEFKRQPLFGQGIGTRIVDVGRANADILDNQWLMVLLETGIVGALAWVWLFVRTIRRLSRASREDDAPAGWLFTALAASLFAFAVGMFTYDTFSFIQVTFVGYILIAFAAVALRIHERERVSAAADLARAER
jgi:hypothetical protein